MKKILSFLFLLIPFIGQSQTRLADDSRMIYRGIPRCTLVVTSGTINEDTYTPVTVTMTNANGSSFASNELFTGTAEVKIRGNTTSNFDNKSWNIKLATSQTMFGWPTDKDYSLLADYQDKSGIRTIFGSAINRAVNLAPSAYPISPYWWASRTQHTEIWLDAGSGVSYQGMYSWCEKIEGGTNRINITVPGAADTIAPYGGKGVMLEKHIISFLDPADKYFYDGQSNVWVTKVPDPDEVHDSILNWAHVRWDDFLYRLYNVSFADTVNGYRAVADVKGFARDYVTRTILDDQDMYHSNSWYMIIPSYSGKLYPGPSWDMNGIIGTADGDFWGSGQNHSTPYNRGSFVPYGCPYYARMIQDTFFVRMVEETFVETYGPIQTVISDLRPLMESMYASGVVAADSARWPWVWEGNIFWPLYPRLSYADVINYEELLLMERTYWLYRRYYYPLVPKSAVVPTP